MASEVESRELTQDFIGIGDFMIQPEPELLRLVFGTNDRAALPVGFVKRIEKVWAAQILHYSNEYYYLQDLADKTILKLQDDNKHFLFNANYQLRIKNNLTKQVEEVSRAYQELYEQFDFAAQKYGELQVENAKLKRRIEELEMDEFKDLDQAIRAEVFAGTEVLYNVADTDESSSMTSEIPDVTKIDKERAVVPQPVVSGQKTEQTDRPLSRGQKKKNKKAMKAKNAPIPVVKPKITESKTKKKSVVTSETPLVENRVMKVKKDDPSPKILKSKAPPPKIIKAKTPTRKILEAKAPPKSTTSSNKLAAPAKQFKNDDVEAPKIIKAEDPPKSSVKVAAPAKQLKNDDVDAQKKWKDQIQIDLQEVRAKKTLDQHMEDVRREKVSKAILVKASKPRFQQSVKTKSNSQKKKKSSNR